MIIWGPLSAVIGDDVKGFDVGVDWLSGDVIGTGLDDRVIIGTSGCGRARIGVSVPSGIR